MEGEAIVVEDDGEHLLLPGDAACWPAGVPNAHHVLNRSDDSQKIVQAVAPGLREQASLTRCQDVKANR